MSHPVRVLIVDDEPPARRKIRRFLRQHPDVEVVGEAGDGAEAVEKVRGLKPDLVFLDIQMPGLDGFAVLEALAPPETPEIIFVTAFDQYAIQAFEVAALDYLLKPFDSERFRQALERGRGRLQAKADSGTDQELAGRLEALLTQLRPETGFLDRVVVRTRDRALPIRTADIGWIQAAGNYVALHVGTRGDQEYLLRETMEGLASRLDPSRFLRVHRSYIVNADHITEIQPWSHGDHILVMKDTARIRLSRRYRDRLPEPFRNW